MNCLPKNGQIIKLHRYMFFHNKPKQTNDSQSGPLEVICALWGKEPVTQAVTVVTAPVPALGVRLVLSLPVASLASETGRGLPHPLEMAFHPLTISPADSLTLCRPSSPSCLPTPNHRPRSMSLATGPRPSSAKGQLPHASRLPRRPTGPGDLCEIFSPQYLPQASSFRNITSVEHKPHGGTHTASEHASRATHPHPAPGRPPHPRGRFPSPLQPFRNTLVHFLFSASLGVGVDGAGPRAAAGTAAAWAHLRRSVRTL